MRIVWQIYIIFRVIGLYVFFLKYTSGVKQGKLARGVVQNGCFAGKTGDLGHESAKTRPRCQIFVTLTPYSGTPRADFAQYLPEVYPGIVFYAGNPYL